MQKNLRTLILTAFAAGIAMASTPGACSLPSLLSTEPMRLNDPCRGAAVTATPGAIYMVALNATPGSQFTSMRFIIQFGAVEDGKVRAYYTWINSQSTYIAATINGKRFGAAATELHMGLFPIGSVLNIGVMNVLTSEMYSATDRYIGWVMKF